MIRSTYQKIVRLAHHKYAGTWLFWVSFAESSFFPVPPDAMLVPIVVANPKKAWWFAALCTLASVLGGLVGYALGAWMYETIGQWLIRIYGMSDQLEAFRSMYAEYGAWIILLKGLTPIPYKLVTIASGLAAYPLLPFIVLSVITRGARFFLLTWLLVKYGESIREQMEKHLERVALALGAIIIIGFIAAKYLF